jgi:cytochrome P450
MGGSAPFTGELDFGEKGNVQDPFPLFAWLRENDPVHWSESLGGWVVTRHRDVLEVFNRPDLFSSDRFRLLSPRHASERAPVQAVARVLRDWLVFRDPPDHTRLRGLLQKSFTPRQLEMNRRDIQRTIDDLLSRVAGRGEMDFIRDFAFPLPAFVICILLGAPTSDIAAIKSWSDRLAAYLGGSVGPSDNFAEAQGGLSELVDYFERLTSERRRAPRDDLMSLMLAAEHEGQRLSPDEVVANCILLLFAGHETTTNLLGNGLHHLLRHPEQERRLRSHPAPIGNAVEEFLRFDGPVPATAKVALHDVEWRGAKLQRGQRVLPFMSAANRDPAAFPDPDALDVLRRPTRHLAFGFGIHFCLGAPLARLESSLAFETLLLRLPELHAEPGRFKPRLFLRGLESLRLRWDAGRAR